MIEMGNLKQMSFYLRPDQKEKIRALPRSVNLSHKLRDCIDKILANHESDKNEHTVG